LGGLGIGGIAANQGKQGGENANFNVLHGLVILNR